MKRNLSINKKDVVINKYTQSLAAFKHLWKTDDEQWLTERKAQWEHISSCNFDVKDSAAYKKLNGKYFIFGEKDEQHLNLLYFLTPIDSVKTAKLLFDSDLFSASEKRALMTEYILIAMKFGEGMPWLKQNIQFFAQGVIGNDYHKLEVKSGRRLKVISPEPHFFCRVFVNAAIDILSGKITYHGYIECAEYAISALEQVVEPKDREMINIDKLISMIDEVLIDKNVVLPAFGLAQSLKEKQQLILNNWRDN